MDERSIVTLGLRSSLVTGSTEWKSPMIPFSRNMRSSHNAIVRATKRVMITEFDEGRRNVLKSLLAVSAGVSDVGRVGN